MGGVTSGYCATGSVNTATPPASTKTIDSTEAKIGRSMKKWEIMAVSGWSSVVSCQRSVCSAGPTFAAIVVRRVADVPMDRLQHCPRARRRADGRPPESDRPVRSAQAQKPIPPPSSAPSRTRADPLRGDGREQARFAEPLDDVEEHGREEDAEER